MADGSKVRVELDMDELVPTHTFATQRRMIDEEGAHHIWNDFGQLRVVINGHPVLSLQIREVGGHAVLEVYPIRDGHLSVAPVHTVELELRGIVPARTGRN